MNVTRKVELYLGTEEDPMNMWVMMSEEEYQKLLSLMEEKKMSKEEAYDQLLDSGELTMNSSDGTY